MKKLDLKSILTILMIGAGITLTFIGRLQPEQWFIGAAGMVLAYYFGRASGGTDKKDGNAS